MSKININEVAAILKRQKIEPAVVREIMMELNAAAEPEKEKTEAGPKSKKEFVIISDLAGSTGWVVQIPADASPATVLERINKAAHEFNASKAGRKNPVSSIGEALESVKRVFMKEAEVLVKTKMPVSIIKTNNKLTEEPSV